MLISLNGLQNILVLLIVIIIFNIFGAWNWLSDPQTAKVILLRVGILFFNVYLFCFI